MRLGVAVHEGHVVEPLGRAEPTGAFDALRREIDAHDVPWCGGAGCVTRGSPGAAADVEHLVTAADCGGGAQAGVVRAQLGLVLLSGTGPLIAGVHVRTAGPV